MQRIKREMDWYVMHTVPGKEKEAVELLEKKIDHKLWESCRVLRKQQLFRIRGSYVLSRKEMFPGYIFIATAAPKLLLEELKKARSFPQIIGDTKEEIAAVEQEDLVFLRNVCGDELEQDMELSTVQVDSEGHVVETTGVLKPYLGNVVRQRLRQRYVIAKVPLFQREEEVLFGIRLDGDEKGS